MNKVENLGQVYTPPDIVELMIGLSKNAGSILEPSAGDGAFSSAIARSLPHRPLTSVEIDPDNANEHNIIMDFFDFDKIHKFDTIIGNPPYVAFKNISQATLSAINSKGYLKKLDNRANLYLFFVLKCIDHLTENGEIIFITPREFIKSTSAIRLNTFLYESGTITHWYEYGDELVFKGASPTVAIWRFEKNNFSRLTKTNSGQKKCSLVNGQLLFTANSYPIKFSDLFFVKVGAVSGMDTVFTSKQGNREFVCSTTKKDGKLRRMFYNSFDNALLPHKEALLSRKIKKFDDTNWWQWGRGMYESNAERIYVNCKTRDTTPFFTHHCKSYDGSLLAIFPKVAMDIHVALAMLNAVDWDELGFKVGGRLCFSQRALENTVLPDDFAVFTKKSTEVGR